MFLKGTTRLVFTFLLSALLISTARSQIQVAGQDSNPQCILIFLVNPVLRLESKSDSIFVGDFRLKFDVYNNDDPTAAPVHGKMDHTSRTSGFAVEFTVDGNSYEFLYDTNDYPCSVISTVKTWKVNDKISKEFVGNVLDIDPSNKLCDFVRGKITVPDDASNRVPSYGPFENSARCYLDAEYYSKWDTPTPNYLEIGGLYQDPLTNRCSWLFGYTIAAGNDLICKVKGHETAELSVYKGCLMKFKSETYMLHYINSAWKWYNPTKMRSMQPITLDQNLYMKVEDEEVETIEYIRIPFNPCTSMNRPDVQINEYALERVDGFDPTCVLDSTVYTFEREFTPLTLRSNVMRNKDGDYVFFADGFLVFQSTTRSHHVKTRWNRSPCYGGKEYIVNDEIRIKKTVDRKRDLTSDNLKWSDEEVCRFIYFGNGVFYYLHFEFMEINHGIPILRFVKASDNEFKHLVGVTLIELSKLDEGNGIIDGLVDDTAMFSFSDWGFPCSLSTAETKWKIRAVSGDSMGILLKFKKSFCQFMMGTVTEDEELLGGPASCGSYETWADCHIAIETALENDESGSLRSTNVGFQYKPDSHSCIWIYQQSVSVVNGRNDFICKFVRED